MIGMLRISNRKHDFKIEDSILLDKNNFQHTLYNLNNPDCLAFWIPTEFSQPLLTKIQHYSVPDFVSELQKSRNQVDLKLLEQYNYLTQYFERTNTDPNNSVIEFNQYWTWLKGKFK